MNGTIFVELRKYVGKKLGQGAWTELLNETGIGESLYVPLAEYPDQQAVDLIAAASKRVGKAVPVTLEDFGEFLAPDLIQMFDSLVDRRWKTLDLIVNAERSMHEVLRAVNPTVKPPKLECRRSGDDAVIILYTSPRKMCALAKGMARGVAKHYRERVDITELRCMHKGSPCCEIKITLLR
jgi:hypothetical protein